MEYHVLLHHLQMHILCLESLVHLFDNLDIPFVQEYHRLSLITFSAILSSSNVVIPGFIFASNSLCTRATILQASLISSISLFDLISIIILVSPLNPLQHLYPFYLFLGLLLLFVILLFFHNSLQVGLCFHHISLVFS